MVHKQINREALAGRLQAEHVLRLRHEPDQTCYEDDLFLIHAPHGGHALGYHLVRHWTPLYHAPGGPYLLWLDGYVALTGPTGPIRIAADIAETLGVRVVLEGEHPPDVAYFDELTISLLRRAWRVSGERRRAGDARRHRRLLKAAEGLNHDLLNCYLKAAWWATLDLTGVYGKKAYDLTLQAVRRLHEIQARLLENRDVPEADVRAPADPVRLRAAAARQA